MNLTQISHRQIRKMFPENMDDLRLYEDPNPKFIVVDLEDGSFRTALRIRMATEELLKQERLLSMALRHDLDLDLLPKDYSGVSETFREALKRTRYFERNFGFMTDLPDKLYEKGKQLQKLCLATMPRKGGRGLNISDLARFYDPEENELAEVEERDIKEEKKGFFSRLFKKKE